MSQKSEVLPIWDVVDDSKQRFTFKENKTTKELSQKIKIAIKGLRKSETKQIRSPDLHFRKLDNSFWYLTIEPRIKQNDSDHYYFGLFLHLKSKYFERFRGQIAKFEVSLNDEKRDKVWSKSSRTLFFNGECGWGWKYFAKIVEIFEESKRSLDINLNLSITSIQMRIFNPSPSEENLSCGDSSNKKLDGFAFAHDLMNDKEYCDFRFVVGDMDFDVHSKLLASKSSIFKKLFATKAKEISITKMDSNVFYELILFIYNGYSPNVEKNCKKLLTAANTFQIPRLKTICDNLCFRDLTQEEAIESLEFADKYRTFSSKLRCLSFIALHLNRIKGLSPENWNRFETENKVLFEEVLELADMKCECLQH